MKPWYIFFHTYDPSKLDWKADVVYAYLRCVKRQQPQVLIHCTLAVWDDENEVYTVIDPSYDGTFLSCFVDINTYISTLNPVSVALSFVPTHDMSDNFVERIDDCPQVTLRAFVNYAFSTDSNSPVCTSYIMRCIGLTSGEKFEHKQNLTPLELLNKADLLFIKPNLVEV
jgi:hypothetical protein